MEVSRSSSSGSSDGARAAAKALNRIVVVREGDDAPVIALRDNIVLSPAVVVRLSMMECNLSCVACFGLLCVLFL